MITPAKNISVTLFGPAEVFIGIVCPIKSRMFEFFKL